MVDNPNTPRKHGDTDAPHISPVTPGEDIRTIAINDINWGAVLAGVAIGLILQLLLNMLGLGFGLATLDPGTSDNPSAAGFGIGAAIWWVLSALFASYTGGWIAGRLAGKPKESTAGLHGVTSWAVTSLIVIYMLSSAVSSVVGGAFGALGGAASGIARTAGGAVATAAPVAANDPAARNSAANAANEVAPEASAIGDAALAGIRAATSNDPNAPAQAREEAAQAMAVSQNIPIEQARVRVGELERQAGVRVEQAKQTATQVADSTAGAVSSAALLAAIALLLGAVASWFGGRAGAPSPTVTRGGRN